MRRILSFVQQQCGGQWVGLSVIHLGETTVLFMILTQSSHPFFIFVVYRILVPSTTLLFLSLSILYRGSRCTQPKP